MNDGPRTPVAPSGLATPEPSQRAAGASAPFRVLVVDDERLARDKLRRVLGEVDASALVAEAADGLAAVEALARFAPDIVFLDIEMPGLSGFEVLEHAAAPLAGAKDGGARAFAVVFQTAFDDFAVKAFAANACDYLLKPYTRERFQQAYEKARRERGQVTRPNAAVAGLRRQLSADRRFLERLCVNERGMRLVLETREVEALVSRDHYTCIHAGAREYLSELALQRLEERLDPETFVRIHRVAIVRVAAIHALSKGDDPEVTLASGLRLPVSRRCRSAVIERLKGGA